MEYKLAGVSYGILPKGWTTRKQGTASHRDLPTLVAEPVKGFELQDAYFWPVEMLDAFRYQRIR